MKHKVLIIIFYIYIWNCFEAKLILSNGKTFIITKYHLIIEESGWYKWKFNIGIKSSKCQKIFYGSLYAKAFRSIACKR